MPDETPFTVTRAELEEPFIAIEIGEHDNSRVSIEAMEAHAEYTVTGYIHDPDAVRRLADRLREGADWLDVHTE